MSPLTRRRLNDLENGLYLPRGRTREEMVRERDGLNDAIRAGQSLDDLGEETNAWCMKTLGVLEERYAALEKRIAATPA